jgi:hypothetical protein
VTILKANFDPLKYLCLFILIKTTYAKVFLNFKNRNKRLYNNSVRNIMRAWGLGVCRFVMAKLFYSKCEYH